ncbi:hypothetical protein [Limnoglobus roseus]|uniref:Uncharacterized protein n=1 Tax=Limnoglobus roseus TaxID=2598579 RepID=A0A5C1AAG4_9BACT|nr:hypothetical protein [Limnoglobus roseus]QEL14038.1 hypothetical protein PX52LOC_00901 [Limnoglobus roseus]
MAGDWIKWTKGLASRREVAVLSAALGRDRHEIAGRLMVLWEWCDDNATDADADTADNVSLCVGDKACAFLDAITGLPGLAEAMAAPGVGWLVIEAAGRVVFPQFARHNGTSAKTRASDATKKRRQRRCPESVPNLSPKCPGANGTKSGLEKRREESNTSVPSELTADAAGVSLPPPSIVSPPPTPPTTTKPKKEPTGIDADLRRAFCGRWERRYGESYPFDYGKETLLLQQILKLVKGDTVKLGVILGRFFADDDPFYAAESRHCVAKLRQNFARWSVEGPPPDARRGGFQSRADAQDERLASYMMDAFGGAI